MTTLRQARRSKLLTRHDLAKLSGVTTFTVRAVETGRRNPTLGTIAKLSGALKIAPAEIIEFKRAIEEIK